MSSYYTLPYGEGNWVEKSNKMKKALTLFLLETSVVFLSRCDDPVITPGSAIVQAELIEAELGPIPTFIGEDGTLICQETTV
jgi:hypothetical protein